MEIMGIPKFGAKLESWYFSLTFDTKIADLQLV
jgi:hypothetical protein